MSDQLSTDLASLKIDRSRDPTRRPLQKIAVVGGIIAAAAIIYFAVVPYVESKVFKREVALTEIAMVSPSQGATQLTSTGYVRPQMVATVAAKISGRVAKVAVRQGDTVAAGDPLFELDQADQRAAIAAARSRVAAARARVQTARANLAETEQQSQRESDLAERGVTPKARAKDSVARTRSMRVAVKAADAEVRAAQAEVKALEVNLESFVVASPMAGTILSKPPEVGEIVGFQLSGIEIADFSTLAVETDVPEQRLHMVSIGGPCEIVLDAFPGTRYRGKTTEIVPLVNRAKATVTVKVGFVDQAKGVLPDMSARVGFLSDAIDPAAVKEPPRLVIPASAVAERSAAKVVFVFEDGKVRMLPVQIGAPYGNGFELLEGPPAGTQVIDSPAADLADGEKVKERT